MLATRQDAIEELRFFIAFFSDIPSELWCMLQPTNHRGQHCAFGHAGEKYNERLFHLSNYIKIDLEIGCGIMSANDFFETAYAAGVQGNGPKERVMWLLNKAMHKVQYWKKDTVMDKVLIPKRSALPPQIPSHVAIVASNKIAFNMYPELAESTETNDKRS